MKKQRILLSLAAHFTRFTLCALFTLSACSNDHSTPEQRESVPFGMDEVRYGQWLFTDRGCVGCHSLSGRELVGPPLGEVAGTERLLENGETAFADVSYLEAAIHSPAEHVTRGYAAVEHPVVTFRQGQAIIAFLQELAGVRAEE